MNTYKDDQVGNTVQILVNDVPHIILKQSDLRGLQSWKMGRTKGRYCAELYMVHEGVHWTIELEYDDPEMSKAVLDLLTKYI